MSTKRVFTVLNNLKDGKTTAFAPGEIIRADLRSRHKWHHTNNTLGLGYVRALMLLLSGGVIEFTYRTDSPGGRATMMSGSHRYDMDWLPDDSGNWRMGGFTHNAGQPTYQVAVLGFLELWKSYHLDGCPERAAELIERWCELLRRLDSRMPRGTDDAWSFGSLEREFTDDATSRAAFISVCSSLEWAIRLILPENAPRDITIAVDPVWDPTPNAYLTGRTLLTTAEVPPAAPEAAAKKKAASAGTRTPAANTETPAAPSDTAPLVAGSYITRIRLALAQPGTTLMLVGPTGTGKSFQTIQAATELNLGLEMVTFDPGLDAQEPIGGYAPRRAASDDPGIDSWLDLWPCGTNGRTPAMGDALRAQTRVQYLALHQQATIRNQWEAIDGPMTRWARRAIAGEDVLLFLDELARGHPGVVSMVMGILNRHSAAAIARMGLTTPDDGAAGTYHLVNAWHTRERLVVPANRVRIVAAANLGDRYQGADLSDPAFRRRWDAWLHLSRYDDDTQRTILAATLDLPARDRLLTALLQVATAVVAYEHANATLISTLDLPTLITWGQTVQARAGSVPRTEAFTTAARDIWIDRLCPLAGDELDGTVRSDLARLVEEAANALS